METVGTSLQLVACFTQNFPPPLLSPDIILQGHLGCILVLAPAKMIVIGVIQITLFSFGAGIMLGWARPVCSTGRALKWSVVTGLVIYKTTETTEIFWLVERKILINEEQNREVLQQKRRGDNSDSNKQIKG